VNALANTESRKSILSTIFLFVTLSFAASASATTVALPVEGLVFHVEADTGVTVAEGTSDVTGWADQSGQGNDLVNDPAVATSTPALVADALNGQPVIAFDGIDDILERTADITGLPAGDADRTIYVVVQYDSTGYGGVAYGNGGVDNEAFGLVVAGGRVSAGNLAVQAWGPNDRISATPGTGEGWLVQGAVAGSGGMAH